MSLVAPKSFMNLSSLSILKLSSCGLQSNVVEYINQPSLSSLDLSSNYDLFPNTIVFSNLFRNLTNLRELDLSSINMSMVSPDSFFNLSSLSSLTLTYCDLRGKFPVSDNFPNLVSLDLSYNENLILQSFSFFKLQKIDWTNLNMSMVPLLSFMNLSSSLSSLSLQNCGLHGKFPGTILQRPNFLLVDLRDNPNITGFLPPMGNWSKSLRSLDLSNTQIPIYLRPDFVTNFNSLQSLSLSGCNFIGSNLALLWNLTQLSYLRLSNNHFSGLVPSSLGNFVNLISLDLSYNNFGGQFPNFLGNLTQLEYLYLSNNRLTGHITSQLGRLSNLSDLYLSSNLLSGTIPVSLFVLPFLSTLDIHNNLLTGQIAQFQHTSSQLFYIDLSYNKLHGPIPISIFQIVSLTVLMLSSNDKLTGTLSSSICHLQNLIALDLSNNSFNGPIPNCMGHFSYVLEVLHLGMNSFNGTIPSTFSKGNKLRFLSFYSNALKGPIPSSIINCRNLELLDLGHNKIVDTFPFFLGALPHLKVLVLRSNKLHGLMTNFTSFPKLQIFDLSNNYLSGPLPSKSFDHFKGMMLMKSDTYITYMGKHDVTSFDFTVELIFKGLEIKLVKIQTILVMIDFSRNKFTGEIPKSIAKLKALILLNLSHNCLIGTIQPSLGNLINLESLDLSSNSLVGKIPLQLLNLKFLQIFQVSYNHLEGIIPTGKQFNTFNISSYEGNLGLCGFPLEKQCESSKTEPPNPSKEADNLSKNGFGWKAVLVGYGCGVIFGFAIGCVIFRARKCS